MFDSLIKDRELPLKVSPQLFYTQETGLPYMGIYSLINRRNGKVYIGMSVNILRRLKDHKYKAKSKDTVLARAIKKYGFQNFDFTILEFVDDKKLLPEREKYWIKTLMPEYNMSEGGLGNTFPLNRETRQRISLKLKKRWKQLPEKTKQRIISTQLIGSGKDRYFSEEEKERLRNLQVGKKHSEETKRKISKANKIAAIGNKNGNKPVIAIKDGVELMEFESLKIAAEHFGVHPSCITKALKGVQKRAANHYWKYK